MVHQPGGIPAAVGQARDRGVQLLRLFQQFVQTVHGRGDFGIGLFAQGLNALGGVVERVRHPLRCGQHRVQPFWQIGAAGGRDQAVFQIRDLGRQGKAILGRAQQFLHSVAELHDCVRMVVFTVGHAQFMHQFGIDMAGDTHHLHPAGGPDSAGSQFDLATAVAFVQGIGDI